MVERTFTIHPSSDEGKSASEALVLRCDRIEISDAFVALGTKDVRIIGQLANSSNGALLGEIETGDKIISVVVKPSMYENPLYDFEWGTLCKREVAACEISQLLGWNLVPPTILRDVDEMESSVQLFIPHDPRQHYFTLSSGRRETMEKFAVFDYITNNADRKGGHILLETENSFDFFVEPETEPVVDGERSPLSGRRVEAWERAVKPPTSTHPESLWGIDHGLTFNVEDKLRTVIWEFSEEPIDQTLLTDIVVAFPKIEERLAPLLNNYEIKKTIERVEKILINPFHRALDANARAFPWPLV